ncbi:MAG: hypothetical protein Q7R41_19110, partial [Phycisphaerales bacterium]|nr:hypothetical protein [Phycisphaerales bacterium]
IAHDFAARPCLISRITPAFGAAPGEAFADVPAQAFTTRLWPLDTPRDWTCPDCNTQGVVPAVPELHRPLANPGPGTTEGASPCADPCSQAVFAAGIAN